MGNFFDVDKELSKLLERNGISINASEYTSIVDIYNSTIKEQSKQYYNYASRTLLLEGILQQTKQGKNPTDIFEAFSDVNHYELYENFMGNSERRRMVNSLKNKGIPLDVLKGVKIDKNGDVLNPLPDIQIRYSFNEDSDSSIYLEYFEIIQTEYDGSKTIVYDFTNSAKGLSSKYTTRSSPQKIKGRKSQYAGRITNTEIGDIKEWVDKNGRTFYTDRYGHRVKVRGGVLQEKIIFGEEV